MMESESFGGPPHPGQPAEIPCGSAPPSQPRPTCTNAIVEAAVEEAAQTLFSAADVPLMRADELLAAVSGAALKAVLEMRIEQIVKHGHTAENDGDLPLLWLPKQARDHAGIACERIGVTGKGRDLGRAKRQLAIAAALCMASIDRIDVEIQRGAG